MTAPSYTTDLQTVDLAEAVTNWAEIPSRKSGGAATLEDRAFIQGSYSISQSTGAASGATVGLQCDYGGNISSWVSGWAIFVWQYWQAPAVIDTWANGGMRIGIGSGTGAIDLFNAQGNDTRRNPYGGWDNIAIDPEYAGGYDERVGSPTAGNYRYFWSAPKMLSAVSKGNPHCVDAIRYGRGELIIEHGETDDYGTFVGLAAKNDNNEATNGYNRWGLFKAEGTGYLWKGLMSFGNATNVCDFRDSNRNITVDDTPRTYAAFNKIEINNASSRVDWIGVNISSVNPSGLSIGQFEMVADATVNFTTCVFTDMSTFVFDSNATLDAVTFRRCALVTQAGADLDNCIFDESPAAVALLVDNPDNIDNCTFNSDGNGHAIELGSACAGNSYTLTDFFVSGYATSDGSTGDEVIYNNSGGSVTLNIDGGSGVSALSIRGGNVTLVANYSFTVTGLESGTEVTIVTSGTSTVLHHTESASTSDGDGKYQITYSHGGGATVDVLIHHIDYKPDISNIYGLTLPGNNSSAKVNMFVDENYENP